MKKILMIAPASFPVTGAEAIVNIKLLKALTDSNEFEIDLVSKKYISVNYPSGALNNYGVKLKSLHTVFVENKITIKSIWQHIANLIHLGVVFKGCHWGYASLSVVKELLKKNDYDYVLTKGEVAIPLGYYAKKRGFKWVATWNDPCPSSMYPAPYGKGVEYKGSISDRKLIKMMRFADTHIFPSRRIANYLQPIVQAKPVQVAILPHVVLETERTHLQSDVLKFIHSGNLYPPRSPRTFLEGLKLFVSKVEDPKICFNILGNLTSEDQNLIANLELDNYVQYLDPVEYNESLRILDNYDVAVIIEADCEEGIYLPTKVTDFMQVHIPIFTVSPIEGTLHDLNMSGHIPYFADVTSAKNIADTIELIYRDFNSGTIQSNHIPETFLPSYIVNAYNSF